MDTYDIIGKLALSFPVCGEQEEYHLLDSGFLETDGHTVWYTSDKGFRFESTADPSVILIGLGIGVLRERT